MANREELGIIRAARAGQAQAQLELGKRYLFGSAALPTSAASVAHWFERAARQGCAEAWHLIGAHIGFDVAASCAQVLLPWYERAYDEGGVHAGLVLAQLVLGGECSAPALRVKARQALQRAVQAGLPDAQRWLAACGKGAARADAAPSLERAAANSVAQVQYALIDAAWGAGDREAFLGQALPLARMLIESNNRATPQQATLLARCASLLEDDALGDAEQVEPVQRFWERAAVHERDAQLALGLAYARMDVDGKRRARGSTATNFKKAIRWLTMAGEQGLAQAWFALGRIYQKPEFSQRDASKARAYLERAAAMGERCAQLECGRAAWRARAAGADNDVRAVFWLQRAAAQGCPDAHAALEQITARTAAWRPEHVGAAARAHYPLLAARIELAALFGLSRAEALLLDVTAADRGHCLVIDLGTAYLRGQRRIVALRDPIERHAFDRIARVFDHVDCSADGPEGNYRQRLYRLNALARWARGSS